MSWHLRFSLLFDCTSSDIVAGSLLLFLDFQEIENFVVPSCFFLFFEQSEPFHAWASILHWQPLFILCSQLSVKAVCNC